MKKPYSNNAKITKSKKQLPKLTYVATIQSGGSVLSYFSFYLVMFYLHCFKFGFCHLVLKKLCSLLITYTKGSSSSHAELNSRHFRPFLCFFQFLLCLAILSQIESSYFFCFLYLLLVGFNLVLKLICQF